MVKYLILTNKQCVRNHILKLSQNSYMHRKSRVGEKHPVGQNFKCRHQDEKKPRQTYRGKPMLLSKAGNKVHLVTRYSQYCLKCLRELMPEQPLVCFERMQQIPLAICVAPSSFGISACQCQQYRNALLCQLVQRDTGRMPLCLSIPSKQRLIPSFM